MSGRRVELDTSNAKPNSFKFELVSFTAKFFWSHAKSNFTWILATLLVRYETPRDSEFLKHSNKHYWSQLLSNLVVHLCEISGIWSNFLEIQWGNQELNQHFLTNSTPWLVTEQQDWIYKRNIENTVHTTFQISSNLTQFQKIVCWVLHVHLRYSERGFHNIQNNDSTQLSKKTVSAHFYQAPDRDYRLEVEMKWSVVNLDLAVLTNSP